MQDRCLALDQCAALTIDGSAITSQPLCHSCVDKLQGQYDDLPDILAMLPTFKGGLWGESGQPKVSKSKGEPPSPLNVHVLDVIDLVVDVLYDVDSLRISELMRHDHGVRRCLRVGMAYQQADRIVGVSQRWERHVAKCPKCRLRTLGALTGDEIIRCSTCGHSLTRDQYAKTCRVNTDD